MKEKTVKSKIVSTAWRLFYEKGYSETTVDEIIEQSGTSKGSFYYYFRTKDELLNSLSEVFDEFYEELDATMNPNMNCFDKLMYLNFEAHKLVEDKINIDILASMYSTQLVAAGRRHLLDYTRTYYTLLTRIISDGQRRGEILDTMPAHEIANYYAMCERSMVTEWCLNKGAYSLSGFSKKFMPIMMEHFRIKK
ncbi:transcriptional regulator, TetR family [Lachnospiraceae bacterium XBB1006]|nr:transcriptional regulator, TetR family [Lachnospiraceae bacterium XBB1006]